MVRVSPQGIWTSSWTYCLVLAGAAAGLRHFWSFPYLVGENGGLAFILLYMGFLLVLGGPLLMAEIVVGRRGRCNPVHSVQHLSLESGRSRAWVLLALLACLVSVLVLSYLSVIASWLLAYIGKLAGGALSNASPALVGASFQEFLSDSNELVYWHSVFLGTAVMIVAAGIVRGVGLAARLLMPLCFVMLIILIVYNLAFDNLSSTFEHFFTLRPQDLDFEAVMEALTLAFFSLGIGMGAVMAFSAYMPEDLSVSRAVLSVIILDTVFALLACLVVFPLVSTADAQFGEGPPLLFLTIPLAFGNITGGDYFGAMFFCLVSSIALLSAIALLEPVTAWLNEWGKIPRWLAAGMVGALVWLGGVAVLLSFNDWSQPGSADLSTFGMIELISAHIALPLGAFFTSIYAAWFLRKEILQDELDSLPHFLVQAWRLHLGFLAPLMVLMVAAYSLHEKLMA